MRYRLSRAAITDIANILLWSEQNFGPETAGRYRTFIDQAFRDVASAAVESDLLQSRALGRPELGQNVGAWHLRRSRDRVAGDKVHAPRHAIIYRRATSYVIIGRLLRNRWMWTGKCMIKAGSSTLTEASGLCPRCQWKRPLD